MVHEYDWLSRREAIDVSRETKFVLETDIWSVSTELCRPTYQKEIPSLTMRSTEHLPAGSDRGRYTNPLETIIDLEVLACRRQASPKGNLGTTWSTDTKADRSSNSSLE